MTQFRSSPRRVLAAAILLGACADGLPVTAQVNHAAIADAQAASAAEVFAPGVISSPSTEQWRITFTPDGKTAYFASSARFFPFTRQATIYESQLVDGAWTAPRVASFSGVYSDIDPFIAPDGQRLYFSSVRPVNGQPRQDIDLWMVERTAEGWGAPIHLGDAVNTPNADELYPSVSSDGTLYFASGPFFPQPLRHFDIYSSTRDGDGFAPRVALGSGVNTVPSPSDAWLQDAWEFNPEISVDGKTLVFTSLRPGGYGFGDLYVSHLVGGEWSAAQNLGPSVNTAADEYHPTLSRNRNTLFFVRRGGARGPQGDFFSIATDALGIK
jgi:Tol biopolymer transport system component